MRRHISLLPLAAVALTWGTARGEGVAPLVQPESLTPAAESVPPPAGFAVPVPNAGTRSATAAKPTPLSAPIGSLSLRAAPEGELLAQMDKIPDNFAIRDAAAERFGAWGVPGNEGLAASRGFASTGFHFAAPAVYSRPLYFEQPNVERYGHRVALCEKDNLSQSALSAAHFFATIPVLPYMLAATPPDVCDYSLGAYRPGSCNPHQLIKPRASAAGVVAQGAAVTGLIFLIP